MGKVKVIDAIIENSDDIAASVLDLVYYYSFPGRQKLPDLLANRGTPAMSHDTFNLDIDEVEPYESEESEYIATRFKSDLYSFSFVTHFGTEMIFEGEFCSEHFNPVCQKIFEGFKKALLECALLKVKRVASTVEA